MTLKLAISITADAKGVAPATAEARREFDALGAEVRDTAAHIKVLATANDQAAAAGRRAMDVARGQGTAERDLRNAVMARAGMAQAQMQNLSFQIQDIGTMLVSGQSPFMLLAQQLPQVTQNGGRLTGVLSALGSTVTNLFSPLGLLTTGFVLAASAAMSYFSDADDEAEKAAEALEEQRDLIRSVADAWGLALPQVRAYADEAERAAALRGGREATGIVIAREFEQANEALGRFIDRMRGVLDNPFMGIRDAAASFISRWPNWRMRPQRFEANLSGVETAATSLPNFSGWSATC